MSNFNQIADQLGQLEAEKAALEAKIKALKEEIKSCGVSSIQGKFFAVSVGTSISQTLDTNAVKAEMGESWFDDHSRLQEIVTIRVKAQVGA